MSQYPDSLLVTISASGSQNASGIWTAGASADYTFSCRAEKNSGGRKIGSNDGILTDYAFQVFMPVTTVVIPEGSDYILTSATNGRVTGKVKGASNGQLNSRVWL